MYNKVICHFKRKNKKYRSQSQFLSNLFMKIIYIFKSNLQIKITLNYIKHILIVCTGNMNCVFINMQVMIKIIKTPKSEINVPINRL